MNIQILVTITKMTTTKDGNDDNGNDGFVYYTLEKYNYYLGMMETATTMTTIMIILVLKTIEVEKK